MACKAFFAIVLFVSFACMPLDQTRADDMAEAIAKAEQAVLAVADEVEGDPTRPVFHFRPPARWMNDTCGAIYYRGYYHVFYQLNPFGDTWGETGTCWGHTRSKDLVTWEHLPIALAPMTDRGERRCNSGCVALNGDGVPMIFYTFVPSRSNATKLGKREQWAAVALDEELRTWRRIEENPLLAAGTNGVPAGVNPGWSDPFVFRAGGRTFATFKDCDGLVAEAENDALTKWKCVGRIAGISGECPNFFKLQDKWVLLQSSYAPWSMRYQVGTFDPERIKFQPDKGKIGILDHGVGSNSPPSAGRGLAGTNVLFDDEGRCLFFGWVSKFKPGRGWAGCMSLPRVLELGPHGHPVQIPAPELARLRGKHAGMEALTLKNESKTVSGIGGDTLEVLAKFTAGDAGKFGLCLRPRDGKEGSIEMVCDGRALDAAGTRVPEVVDPEQKTLDLHVFFDKSVLELFINDGRKTVTKVVYPGSRDLQVEVFCEEGSCTLRSVDAWELGSIW